MAGKSLKIDVRRGKIMALLERDHSVTVAQLSQVLGATPVTIRNDLAALAAENRLRRGRGGAMTSAPQPEFGALSEEKLAIAEAFALRVQEKDRLFINSGSTSRAVCHALRRFHSLAIVTNSPPVARMLSDRFPVVLLGGDFQNDAQVLVGPILRVCAQQFFVDKLFVGVDGYSERLGFMTNNHLRVQAVRDMAEQADKVIVLTESSKFARSSTVPLAVSGGVHAVITDSSLRPEDEAMLGRAGIRVYKAE